jgi:hypothetical protein
MTTTHSGGRMRRRYAGLLLAAAALSAAVARAGGGPENVLLVVNPASADSLAVANAYIELRAIQPLNVLLLPWKDGDEATTIERFRAEILVPVLRTIESRGLAAQIDQVVYSSGFPWRIDFGKELSAELAKAPALKFPSGSLTGMTMLFNTVQSGQPAWLDTESNDYFRPLGRDGVPETTQGFRAWYGWGQNGDLLEAGGTRYILSVVLGVTAGRGYDQPSLALDRQLGLILTTTKPLELDEQPARTAKTPSKTRKSERMDGPPTHIFSDKATKQSRCVSHLHAFSIF